MVVVRLTVVVVEITVVVVVALVLPVVAGRNDFLGIQKEFFRDSTTSTKIYTLKFINQSKSIINTRFSFGQTTQIITGIGPGSKQLQIIDGESLL